MKWDPAEPANKHRRIERYKRNIGKIIKRANKSKKQIYNNIRIRTTKEREKQWRTIRWLLADWLNLMAGDETNCHTILFFFLFIFYENSMDMHSSWTVLPIEQLHTHTDIYTVHSKHWRWVHPHRLYLYVHGGQRDTRTYQEFLFGKGA